MENKTFKFDVMNEDRFDKDIKATFSFDLKKEAQEFVHDLIFTKISQGNINYNLTSLFFEGLDLLKEKNPEIPNNKPVKRRYYRGGRQKDKGEIYRTSIVSTIGNKNWIDNFILNQTLKDLYFSKTDFINLLLYELKNKYQGKIKKIPKKSIDKK